VPVSTSTIFMSVSGNGSPTVPGLRFEKYGVECVVGDVSERPYPSLRDRPKRRSNSSITSTGHGAPPLLNVRTRSRPNSFTRGWLRSDTKMVGTAGKYVG